MKKIVHLLILFVALSSVVMNAQTFTNLNNGFPSVEGAFVAWADYDNDGKPDFAFAGFSSSIAEVSRIYHNDGDGTFSLAYTLNMQVTGAVSWGDYDQDGDLDLLVNGQNGGPGDPAITTLVRNDGSGVFTEVPIDIPGVIGVSRWIDYDGDGWPDVLTCGLGVTLSADSTRLFHNNSNGTFTEVSTNLPDFLASYISVVDYDNDGDMDLFVPGESMPSSGFPLTKLYRNEGGGNFTEVPFPFINLATGTSKWADFDNDGDLDVLYDGLDSTGLLPVTVIYRNDGEDDFTLMNTDLPGSGEPGTVDWADVDNDGDLDVLLGGPTALLRNDGNNMYTDITPPDFPFGAALSFQDIDNDGDQDVLALGLPSTIFRNELLTGVNEPSNADKFSVYPNPAQTDFTLSTGETLKNARVDIVSMTGREIYQSVIVDQTSVIHFDEPAGIYFVKITDDKGQNTLRLIVK